MIAVSAVPRRVLGRTGLSVSALGFGTAPLGDLYAHLDDGTAIAAVERGEIAIGDTVLVLGSGPVGINAIILLVIATIGLPSTLLTSALGIAGFLGGVIAPSRDMLVRNAAPSGAAGRAFGIVSTGFNFSGILSPLLFGWIMDQNMPHWVFGASVVFMVFTVLLALVTDRKPRARSDGPITGAMHS